MCHLFLVLTYELSDDIYCNLFIMFIRPSYILS
jgi:hypothetical protein